MWISGITQGLMWRAFNDDGTLTYSFIETVKFTYPYYGLRLLGGLMFFSGMLVMVYNVYRTISTVPSRTGCRRTAGIERESFP